MSAGCGISGVEPFRFVQFDGMLTHVGLGFKATLPHHTRFPWSGNRAQKSLVVTHRVQDRINLLDAESVKNFFFRHGRILECLRSITRKLTSGGHDWKVFRLTCLTAQAYSCRKICAACAIAWSLWYAVRALLTHRSAKVPK